MTPAQFRRMALAMPEAVEGAHQDHPDFRVNGRVFATLHADGERGMVKVPMPEQQRLVRAQPMAFAPASGSWGRAGCTMVTLAAATTMFVQDAMTMAWQMAMAAAPSRAKAKASRSARKPEA